METKNQKSEGYIKLKGIQIGYSEDIYFDKRKFYELPLNDYLKRLRQSRS